MAKEVNTVVCAMRKTEFRAVLGYFDTIAAVPADWKICDPEYNITDVMAKLNIKRDYALRLMNQHWQDFTGRSIL